MIPRNLAIFLLIAYGINCAVGLARGEHWMAWRAFVIAALCVDRIGRKG